MITTEVKGVGEIAKALEKMQKEIAYLSDYYVVVGIITNSTEDGVKIIDYAIWNEYGTYDLRIPSRPFFRTAVATPAAQLDISNYVRRQYSYVMSGRKTGKQALDSIGMYVKGKIQKNIKNGNWVANAESTQKIKGKNNPLIDTSSLIKSIDYVIVRG